MSNRGERDESSSGMVAVEKEDVACSDVVEMFLW
jgi:hypothetical protein